MQLVAVAGVCSPSCPQNCTLLLIAHARHRWTITQVRNILRLRHCFAPCRNRKDRASGLKLQRPLAVTLVWFLQRTYHNTALDPDLCVDSAHQNLAGRLEDLGLQDESEFDMVDWLEQHEPRMRRRLEQLYTNQGEIDSLLQQLLQERKALDLKYQKLLGPTFSTVRLVGLLSDWPSVCHWLAKTAPDATHRRWTDRVVHCDGKSVAFVGTGHPIT